MLFTILVFIAGGVVGHLYGKDIVDTSVRVYNAIFNK